MVSLGGHKRYRYGDLAVWPYFTFLWFDFEDMVLKEEQIVLNSLPNGTVFACKSKLSFLLPFLEIRLRILLIIRRVLKVMLILICLLALHHLPEQHQLLSLFFIQLLPQQLLFRLLFLLRAERSPFKVYFHIGFVHDLKSLLSLQSYVALFHWNECLAQVDVG